MKIKVVIYSDDKKYIEKLLQYYELHQETLDMYDIHVFSNQEKLISYLESNQVDVLLSDEKSGMELTGYTNLLCAYLAGDNSVRSVNGIPAIGKYQKADNIFRDIFNCFAEKNQTGVEYSFSNSDVKTRTLMFYHAAGGTGCSTVAAAYAMYLASNGKKVFYLNLELTGASETFFKAEGKKNFSEVIYSLKSRNENFPMKLMTCAVTDRRGVSFVNSSTSSPDMLELTSEDTALLLDALKHSCDFEYLIIDTDPGMDDKIRTVMEHADTVLFVAEATEACRIKYDRCINGLRLLDSLNKTKYASKVKVIYNKYKEFQEIQMGAAEIVGGIPVYENMSAEDIAAAISGIKIFENI